jgi:hypothetical protein
VGAKQTKRRLECKWKSIGLETVRIAYRAACRAANKLITESRRAFYACRVKGSSSDPHQCYDVITPIIVHLANLSFAEGRFPNRFKVAQVTPLLKKDVLDASDPASYHPISNLYAISKIIERLCLARLMPHVVATGHFNPLQSAYQRNLSTGTVLLKILNDLNRIIDDQRSAVLIGLDLSAAFDTIEHDILIQRLRSVFGATEFALQWVETYLRDREQYMMAGGQHSTSSQCEHSVPQGSVLGAFLLSLRLTHR